MNNIDENNLTQVAELLYYEKNPDTKMDVPSFAYELVEKWRIEWLQSKSELTFYNWIKANKTLR